MYWSPTSSPWRTIKSNGFTTAAHDHVATPSALWQSSTGHVFCTKALKGLNNGDENEWKKKLDRQVDRYWALGTCCFAGANDELVVATSSHHKDLYVWSVPNGRFNTIVLDQPRRLPSGKQWITAMGYSKHRSSLIACYNVGSNGDIKVWCPFRLPQLPH